MYSWLFPPICVYYDIPGKDCNDDEKQVSVSFNGKREVKKTHLLDTIQQLGSFCVHACLRVL